MTATARDRLAALSAIQSHQGVNPRGVEEADVFASLVDLSRNRSQFVFVAAQRGQNRVGYILDSLADAFA